MNTRNIFASAALAAASFAAPALARADSQGGNSENAENVSGSLATVPVAPTGLAFQLGGGVTAFSRQDARDRFGTGGYWDLRAILGTESFIGAELAYIGSARAANGAGLASDASLLGDGAEAAVRANLPLHAGALRVEPFLFGGAGWTYYNLVHGNANTVGIKQNANAFVIPFGAGVSLAYQHFTVDARFTYRSVFDDDLVKTGSDRMDLQNWAAGLTVGYQL
jgi:hypothetical protein